MNPILPFLQTIPKGKVTTYALLGKHFGVHPRTIASILKQNQDQETFPCYKVVHNDGKIGGYNLGKEEKVKRLTLDGIEIKNEKIEKKYFYNN